DDRLRKLRALGVRCDMDALRLYPGHILARFHLPRRQISFLRVACRHGRDFAVVDLSRDSGLTRCINLVSPVLPQLSSKEVMSVLVLVSLGGLLLFLGGLCTGCGN